jgi:hypothetical protein
MRELWSACCSSGGGLTNKIAHVQSDPPSAHASINACMGKERKTGWVWCHMSVILAIRKMEDGGARLTWAKARDTT